MNELMIFGIFVWLCSLCYSDREQIKQFWLHDIWEIPLWTTLLALFICLIPWIIAIWIFLL